MRVARVCLDCEEIHDQQQCPVCASETFAYLSRWVPSPERRTAPRDPATTEAAAAGEAPMPRTRRDDPGRPSYAPPNEAAAPRTGRKVAYGVAGVAAAVLAGMWYRGRKSLEDAAERGAGELK